jgi:hypothetical protein
MLSLKFREVAKKNITDFDRLGAFAGHEDCQYHYGDGTGCAIGICDVDRVIPSNYNSEPINSLVINKLVDVDNMEMIRLIQSIHDFKTSPNNFLKDFLIDNARVKIPSFLYPMIDDIQVSDLTENLYKDIMKKISEIPE